MALANLRVVLINTSHPGNIGGVARAMKNMCCERLYLVGPRAAFPHPDATARASGADDLLGRATVVDSLDQALVGCRLVIGASARSRAIPWPQVDAREAAALAVEAADGGDVALLFGREDSGLTNAELERCHYLLHIPCNPAYSSLNLAAAVQVVCYEMLMAAGAPRRDEAATDPPATAEEVEDFFRHLERTLVDIDFLDPNNPRLLMRRLRRLYNRARLEKTEVNILRGILTETAKQAARARRRE